jgi:hypothetical protein
MPLDLDWLYFLLSSMTLPLAMRTPNGMPLLADYFVGGQPKEKKAANGNDKLF